MIKQNLKIFLLMLVLAFVLYGNSIAGQFVYDDVWVINKNVTLQSLKDLPRQFILPYHYLQPDTGLYRPLTLISYSLNFIFGEGPASFHIINIILHALNSFLIFILLTSLYKSKPLAWASSLLFLFLPIHTEAITFISGRSDLLATLFALLALLFLIKGRYWLSSGAFLLGLLAKESVLGFVLLIPFILIVVQKKSLKQAFRGVLAYIPAGGVYILLRFLTLKSYFLSNDADYVYNPLKFVGILPRFLTALKVFVLYLAKTFVPINLSADYSLNQIPVIQTVFNGYVIIGLAILAGIIFLLFWKKTRDGLWGFGSALFLFSYLVISNFIFPIGTIMAERTFYLPSVGICLIVAGLFIYLLKKASKLAFFLGISILIIYAILIVSRNPVWANQEALFKNMIQTAPQSVHAKTNLGIDYIKSGQWNKGKPLIEESYKIAPDHLPTLDSLGVIAEHEGRYADAEQFYLKAIGLRPHYATALFNLGRLYFQFGQYEKSSEIFWGEFSYHPNPPFLLVYAMSQSKLGNFDTAISKIKEYYGEMPADINLRFALGYAYYKKGDKVTADKYFKTSKNPAMSDEEFIKSIEEF